MSEPLSPTEPITHVITPESEVVTERVDEPVTPIVTEVVTEPVYKTGYKETAAPITPDTDAPSGSDFKTRAQVSAAKAKDFVEAYAFEIFLVVAVLFFAIFAIVFTKIALIALAALVLVSGWIAYLGLRRKGTL